MAIQVYRVTCGIIVLTSLWSCFIFYIRNACYSVCFIIWWIPPKSSFWCHLWRCQWHSVLWRFTQSTRFVCRSHKCPFAFGSKRVKENQLCMHIEHLKNRHQMYIHIDVLVFVLLMYNLGKKCFNTFKALQCLSFFDNFSICLHMLWRCICFYCSPRHQAICFAKGYQCVQFIVY